jgi:hypothetical protein
MVVRILTFFVWRISVLRIDLRIKEHISEEMGVTSSQAFNDLDTYPVCFPPAHETPITSAPDHVMVSGARYELGRPIPMDIGIRFRWHLGRPVLAQAIDETGMPLQHVPPINLDDPGVRAGMTLEESHADVLRRLEDQQVTPPEPVPPIIGKLALLHGKPRYPVVRTPDNSDHILSSSLYRLQPILLKPSDIARFWALSENQLRKAQGRI